MDRREWIGSLGALGTAFPLLAADHAAGSKPHGASPLAGAHAHFCGIHMAKKDPSFQLITQHYCTAHSEHGHDDLFQCVLFDRTGPGAKLLGVEYIVSDSAYRKLPKEEKKYWHPHTYEVLGGGLIAPEMAPDEEMKFMKMLLTTWGKAWHTWPDPNTAVPIGEPLLIWSLMGDSQVDSKLVAARDKEFNCSTAKVSANRRQAMGYEVPDVAPPANMNTIGRQWNNTGEDKPRKRK